jgi:shikimate kinase
LRDALTEASPAVVACGGGVVVRAENRDLLVAAAGVRVVWLRARIDTLLGRTRQQSHRPLLDDDPALTLQRLHLERAELYGAVADDVIDVDDLPTARVVRRVTELVRAGTHRAASAQRHGGVVA